MAQVLLGTLTAMDLFSFLCATFQQFAMLSAADTPTGKGARQAAPFWKQKELIYKQPRCSVKSPGRQKQKVIGFRLSKKGLMRLCLTLLKNETEWLLFWLCIRTEKMNEGLCHWSIWPVKFFDHELVSV